MRVKLFTFRYSATLGGFDDTPLAEFIRDKEVLSFREHFFQANEVAHLACVVAYQDAVVSREDLEAAREIPPRVLRPGSPGGRRRAERDRPDPCAGLAEPERVLFNTLREWRARKAHEEGVPPYLVFTNRELLEIVRRRPESANALGHLNGIGPGKVKRYAAEVLRLLRGAGAGATADGSAAPGAAIGLAEDPAVEGCAPENAPAHAEAAS
jgi:superfamily II DNA helicase RecQ